ncbi:MAG: hypothetical protein ACOYK8_09490 [Alphaproteobacteria bacterium]
MAIRHPHLPKVPTLYYPVSPTTIRQEVEYLALGFPQAEIIPLLGPSQQHWLEEKKAPALANQFTLAATGARPLNNYTRSPLTHVQGISNMADKATQRAAQLELQRRGTKPWKRGF